MSEPEPSDPLQKLRISKVEANFWWRKHSPAGALLNNLMVAFIVVPVILVFKSYYKLSFLIFAFMAPYGFLMQWLAVYAVRAHLARNPESVVEFRDTGIIL